jgi:mycofactocin system glycosyltransferase
VEASSPAARRYRLDASVQHWGRVVVGGSPLKLFRLSPAGQRVFERLVAGEPVADSGLVTSLLEAGAVHPVSGAPVLDATDVTLVVPVFGALSRVPPGAVVVDDGSAHPVAGATVRFETNRGPAAARNAGLARVTTPLVAFVDADVELADGWLEPLLPHFADPTVGLVAPRVCSPGTATVLERYEGDCSPLDLGAEPARIRAGSRVSYVPAAAIVCRVEAVKEVGGFDESMRFGEDVDLVWRLDAAGWRCRYEPSSQVRHDPRPTWRDWARQRIGYGSSAAPLARRHPGALAPLRMSGWSVATWLLAALGRPLIGALVGSGSAAALVRKLPDVPPRAAFALAAEGNLRAGEQIAGAIRRVWWPLLAIAAWRSRTARRILLAAALAARNPIRLADDVAYSLGVWRGIIAERTLDPLVPEISSWPGRRSTEVREDRTAPPADGR